MSLFCLRFPFPFTLRAEQGRQACLRGCRAARSCPVPPAFWGDMLLVQFFFFFYLMSQESHSNWNQAQLTHLHRNLSHIDTGDLPVGSHLWFFSGSHICGKLKVMSAVFLSFFFFYGLSQILLLSGCKITVLNCRQNCSATILDFFFWKIPGKTNNSQRRAAARVAGKPEVGSESALLVPFFMECALCLSIFFVNPEATLCSADEGEAALLHLCACATLGWSVDYSWLWFLFLPDLEQHFKNAPNSCRPLFHFLFQPSGPAAKDPRGALVGVGLLGLPSDWWVLRRVSGGTPSCPGHVLCPLWVRKTSCDE